MNENDLISDTEVTLFDLWETLKNGWKLVVSLTAVGLIAAISAVVLMAPQYEAIALVQISQIGQIGQIGQTGQTGQIEQAVSLPVEPAAQAVERIKTPKFQLKVAEAIGNQQWAEDLMRSAAATSRYLSLQIVKATATAGAAPLIELKARAGSPEDARKIADGVITELAKRHEELAKPLVDKIRRDLAIAKEFALKTEHELDAINKLVAGAVVKDDRFTQLSLMTDLRLKKESEVIRQRQTIVALETALGRPSTQPAEALEEIYVSNKPVSPKKALLLALGLIGGLFVGVALVFITDAWQRLKQQKENQAN